MIESGERTGRRGIPRARLAVSMLLLGLTLTWGCAVRTPTERRVISVHGRSALFDAVSIRPRGTSGTLDATGAPVTDTIRVLAWNIAHGRGDLMQGHLRPSRAGESRGRGARMARIAEVILEANADVVVLNEVDFDAAWSRGRNQAALLAWAAEYPAWVEQRNFDYSVLSADFAFGNAVLSRLPIREVRLVPIPPHSELEAAVLGAKTASGVEVVTAAGPVMVVPIHLEFRSEATRLAAVPALTALQNRAPPLILAGDFNSAPLGWPGARDTTAVGRLQAAGFASSRTARPPSPEQFTYPSARPARAIDWVLAEAPLRVLEARVLTGAPEASDHLPVLSVVEVR